VTTLTIPQIEMRDDAPARHWPAWLQYMPLVLVLAAQTYQSCRLLSSPISFDEARYIYAGHALLNELIHGGGSPYYETYYSGAPVIFCPLAGIADTMGGLACVRLLCLSFSLIATVLLFASARRLFGYTAAVASCTLFVAMKLTYFVATYASYDSMALMFLALALYCAVRSKEARWLLLVACALVLANATKYMTVIFDPVVVAAAALQGRFWRRFLSLGLFALIADALALYLAGTAYLQGVLFSTLARKGGASALLGAQFKTAHQIVVESMSWIGVPVVLAFVGLAVALMRKGERKHAPLLAVLALAGVLVTLEGIHLRSDESMNQHDDFSALFACIPAGYLAARVMSLGDHIRWRQTVVACILIGLTVPLWQHADPVRISTINNEQTRPQQYQLFARLAPYLSLPDGNDLIAGDTDYAMLYVDKVNLPWYRYDDDSYIKYPIPGRGGDVNGTVRGPDCLKMAPACMYLSGPAGYKAAVYAHFFAFITLVGRNLNNPTLMLQQDKVIEKAVKATHGYAPLPNAGGLTWIYLPYYERYLQSHPHLR
jgi:4-amino-4-deoxy-L-arabinose transferase-like glycosyltransferase